MLCHGQSGSKQLSERSAFIAPVFNHSSPRWPAPWWTIACSRALCNRRNALRILRQNSRIESLVHFKKLRIEARYTFGKAKRGSWNHYPTSGFTHYTTRSEMWSKICTVEEKQKFLPSSAFKTNNQLLDYSRHPN